MWTIRLKVFSILYLILLSLTRMISAQNYLCPSKKEYSFDIQSFNQAITAVVSISSYSGIHENHICRVGSGFIYHPDGYVVTKWGVIRESDSVQVQLINGNSYIAETLYHDEEINLALLKISGYGFSPISLGDVLNINQYQHLALLGNALSIFPSVTIVRYLGKRSDGMLNLEGIIPPGGCGGPVIDESGQLVGIAAGRHYSMGEMITEDPITVIFPIEKIQNIIDPIIRQHQEGFGWIGISVIDLKDAPDRNGVRVVGVETDSPADHSRIVEGDTLTSFNGRSIVHAKELAYWVKNTPPNKVVNFTVLREGKDRVFRLKVGRSP